GDRPPVGVGWEPRPRAYPTELGGARRYLGFVVNAELLREYAADESRRGPEPPGAHTGAAGGSLCGDLVRISLETDAGVVRAATFDAEGCAALRACAAAACEELEGAAVLDAARLSADRIAELVGGVSPQG